MGKSKSLLFKDMTLLKFNNLLTMLYVLIKIENPQIIIVFRYSIIVVFILVKHSLKNRKWPSRDKMGLEVPKRASENNVPLDCIEKIGLSSHRLSSTFYQIDRWGSIKCSTILYELDFLRSCFFIWYVLLSGSLAKVNKPNKYKYVYFTLAQTYSVAYTHS